MALLGLILLAQTAFATGGKLLEPLSLGKRPVDLNDRKVVLSGFNSMPSNRNILNLERDKPWSLPKRTAEAAAIDTLRIVALRFDFVEEIPDDPLTTGTGKFDFRPFDSFVIDNGHEIDPSPHNREYFESHLQALANYYFFVSDFKLILEWDVYPRESESVYHLAHTMGYYGSQDPQEGLTEYFIDCIQLADTTESEIVFADYDSYFLFHAGSDRQNDIGFPETPGDLFTGYIFFLDSALYVDNDGIDSTPVRDALIMAETASQDNRATALNAVIAHEFGHQLGLVDLYRTDNFFTRVGDFALMDNNGFGTGVDFGFEVGRAFGTSPVYPMAWSRAFLGFDEPVVYREGTSIELAAAEMATLGTRIAKIPISEYEYYLLENRREDIDGKQTYVLADSITSVIQGPSDFQKNLTGEHDFLLPGSGILIWHVDEIVAFMDYDGDGLINFFDNQLQNDPGRPFVELMEADGLVNFGGNYYSGFGTQEDMYYAGNNSSFTPNTNPPAMGHGGTNTHIYVTNISDTNITMTFDLESDFRSGGFPQRAGIPVYGLSPVAADLNTDGSTEIIVASGRNLIVLNEDGSDFTPPIDSSLYFYDTTYFMENPRSYPIPLFDRLQDTITAGPVIGDFGLQNDTQYVAIATGTWLHVYGLEDADLDGRAERKFDSLSVGGWEIVWLSFGNSLTLARIDNVAQNIRLIGIPADGSIPVPVSPLINERELYGAVRIDDKFALIAGDTSGIRLYYVIPPADLHEFNLEGNYIYGPVAADLDRDSVPEVIVASPEGSVKAVSIDDRFAEPQISLYNLTELGDSIYVNPAIADVDEDGYPDILLGGRNMIYALDRNFISLLNFPVIIDRAFPDEFVLASPVVGDINNDGTKDIIALTSAGNCYALGSSYALNDQVLYGFPLAAGGIGIGSPVIYEKSNGGGLGFLGIDGWFYSYDVGYDPERLDWPMGGGNAAATYYFPESKLGQVKTFSDRLPDNEFFCYPNPTLDGKTRIRYFVGDDADLTLIIYDMSGKRVSDEYKLSGAKGTYNEMGWDGSSLPTGVYRCVIEASFTDGETSSAFTDIAIIK